MPLLSEDRLAAEAEKRGTYRLIGVTTKLSPREVADVERLAKRRGQQRGELIRQLILDELSRDGGEPTASAELSEIVGLRLMLMNVLKPLAAGQKLTPEVFDGIMTEVKKRKRAVAVEARQEAERAGWQQPTGAAKKRSSFRRIRRSTATGRCSLHSY